MKTCPYCAEDIQDAAIVCKHCGRELGSVSPNTQTPAPAPIPAAPSAKNKRTGLAALVLIPLGFLIAMMSSAGAGLGVLLLWLGLGLGLSGGAVLRWGGGFIAALMLGGVAMAIGGNSPAPSTQASGAMGSASRASSAAVEEGPVLELLSSKGYESEYGGYHYVEGQVKNISTEPLKSVVAVATWMDKDGNFIKSDDAMIDYNPILPGQTSPFKTITSGNPAMSKYRVEFKFIFGGTLAVRDARK